MAHLSVSQIFLVFVSEPAVSLQPAFTLSLLLSPPPQHLAGLQPAIILALTRSPSVVSATTMAGIREQGIEDRFGCFFSFDKDSERYHHSSRIKLEL